VPLPSAKVKPSPKESSPAALHLTPKSLIPAAPKLLDTRPSTTARGSVAKRTTEVTATQPAEDATQDTRDVSTKGLTEEMMIRAYQQGTITDDDGRKHAQSLIRARQEQADAAKAKELIKMEDAQRETMAIFASMSKRNFTKRDRVRALCHGQEPKLTFNEMGSITTPREIVEQMIEVGLAREKEQKQKQQQVKPTQAVESPDTGGATSSRETPAVATSAVTAAAEESNDEGTFLPTKSHAHQSHLFQKPQAKLLSRAKLRPTQRLRQSQRPRLDHSRRRRSRSTQFNDSAEKSKPHARVSST
jgi:hypothetical protein